MLFFLRKHTRTHRFIFSLLFDFEPYLNMLIIFYRYRHKINRMKIQKQLKRTKSRAWNFPDNAFVPPFPLYHPFYMQKNVQNERVYSFNLKSIQQYKNKYLHRERPISTLILLYKFSKPASSNKNLLKGEKIAMHISSSLSLSLSLSHDSHHTTTVAGTRNYNLTLLTTTYVEKNNVSLDLETSAKFKFESEFFTETLRISHSSIIFETFHCLAKRKRNV